MKLGLCVALLSACAPGTDTGDAVPVVIPNRYHVSDGFLRDPSGRALLLDGVNYSNSSKDPSTAFLGWAEQDDITALAGWGFDSIRLLTFWEAIAPSPGVYDEAYLDALATRVQWATDAGLLVILDLHQDLFGRGFGNGGAPTWACDASVYETYVPKDPWWLNYLADEVETCFDAFWASDDLKASYAAAAAHLALRFADDPSVIGLDLMNEPYWGTMSPASFEADVLQPFYADVMAEVEEVAPGKVFFVEPTIRVESGTVTPAFTPFTAEVVYAPHYYLMSLHEGIPYDGDATPMETVVETYAETAASLGAPLWVGEYGGPPSVEGCTDYLADLTDLYDAALAGSAYYAYDPLDREWFSFLDADGVPDPDVMAVLGRVRPRVVGGDPVSLVRDGVDRFSLTVRRRAGVDPSVTAWVGDPDGVTVTCDGSCGRWEWRADAATGLVEVTLDPAVEEATVTVAR